MKPEDFTRPLMHPETRTDHARQAAAALRVARPRITWRTSRHCGRERAGRPRNRGDNSRDNTGTDDESPDAAHPRGDLARADHIFPTLTPAQIARIAAHGAPRAIQAGEMLVEEGAKVVPFFVVTGGQLEIVRFGADGESLVAEHGPGQFTGEVNMLSGRRALVRGRVREPGEVIELDREQLLALVQTDAELSEILMRAFILRRVELIAHGLGDVVLIGSMHSPARCASRSS